ncbi:MAG: FAD-dependent oxidoreductase [Verrucomicrobia bacterium]|nr:FAD-dependent oxidoreductase [Verrucomicrobiota bacterium]
MVICVAAGRALSAETVQTAVLVYGATSSGVVAAVAAARQGASVVLAEPGWHVGGMTSGGLGQTDIGNKGAIGGIAREFYRRLGRHYGQPEAWTFEPSVAEETFTAMLREVKVPVYFQQRIASVKLAGRRILEATMENGNVFRAQVFIDTTYEGDLMARAGVSFTVGREANSQYHETLDGIRAQTPAHQFLVPVDPYVRRGDPASGLLPLIQPRDGGRPGDGDRRVQAYNFRLCLTQNPANRRPIAPPADYDPGRYELLARYLEALVAVGRHPRLGDVMHIQKMPNGKTDINNNGAFSTDDIGASYDYPDAGYTARARIWQAHADYTRGFLHFLASSPRVPENIRAEMQSWGLCRDEFPDTGGWPHQLYVREARRMVTDYVMTEHNCRGILHPADSIGLAAYGMDSHNCQRIVKDQHVENEGDVQVHGFSPYPIAYRAITPRATECENLLVPVCLSATHIAYGSIRMEPVFMVLGQSAATAACLAVQRRAPVQQVPYPDLRQRLQRDRQILEWPATPKPTATQPK